MPFSHEAVYGGQKHHVCMLDGVRASTERALHDLLSRDTGASSRRAACGAPYFALLQRGRCEHAPSMYSMSTCWNSHRHEDGEAMLLEIREMGFECAELSHGIRQSLVPGIVEEIVFIRP